MIIGVGIDIIELKRVKKAIESEAFIDRVYTKGEAEYCRGRGRTGVQSFAGRFAAKEAVLKAFGTGLRKGSMQEIEVINDELGCPQVKLYGWFEALAQAKGVKKIWLSISHSGDNAVAQCVMEG
ncbi:holo-ACP synthase [Anaerovibrio sp.]|uniref:holo-ACP synthase n=1 Tax=Anaerovibrio sp. TaxID=1872532 RepID=UPI0025BE27DB|nr:holo-ACP synthase [Anaerovibrio sp.]MBR2142884.1 holo-ACP synthase [Anaerovibrio sp.]